MLVVYQCKTGIPIHRPYFPDVRLLLSLLSVVDHCMTRTLISVPHACPVSCKIGPLLDGVKGDPNQALVLLGLIVHMCL